MANKSGQVLTNEEVAELHEYRRLGIAPPDKFAGVVFDNTNPTGGVWRYPTDAERTAADEAAKAQAKAADDAARLTERVRAEAAKRGMTVEAAPPAPRSAAEPAKRG